MAFFGLEAEEYDRKYGDIGLIKRILSYFYPYSKKMLIVIIFLTFSSLSNAFVPILSRNVVAYLEFDPDPFILILIIIIIFFLNFVGWFFNYFQQKNSARVIGNVVFDLRKDADNAALNRDLSFYDKNPTGKIVSRINTDSRDFGDAIDLFMRFISSILIIIILLIFMIYVQIYLALIFITTIPIFFFVALLFRKIARKQTLLGQRALARVNAFIQESVNGIQLAKTFRREDKLYEKFNEINEQSYKVNLKRGYVLNFIFPILNVIQAILLTLIVYFGGNMIIFGTIKAADLFLFTQGLTLFLFPIITISAFWPQFQAGMSAAERIFSIIDTSPVVKQSNSLNSKEIMGEIEFRNLSFQYKEDTKIFDNFSLKIRPGESIAIVGRTGAGKSTLANLLIRFYEFQEGEILIDKISIRDFDLNFYRRQIGYVGQLPFLFNDTIENNIRYGKPDASRDEILEILKKIGGIQDWLGNLSNGLETRVGERGQLISLGQRQLIAFARVLLEDPKIFILDEATASVDPFTETKIQETLDKIIKGTDRTSIVIAHRLWTVRHVDRIIVLDNGEIVEAGSHDQLMEKSGFYADLYNKYFRHQSYEYVEKCESLE